MEPDDALLLRDFRLKGSQEAFAQLARRHAGLLYHTALRRTGRPDLAEEAAQNALAILARKAGSVQADASLAPWLHRAVCFEASKLLRRERRHDERMKRLDDPALAPVPPGDPGVWEFLAPHLDEAMNGLSESDRQVVLLKYFDGLSFEEMARRLGGKAEAWRQRGSRALERLRRRLARRGAVVPSAVLAAGLGGFLTQSAPAAVSVSLASAPLVAAATLSWKTLALHTLHTMNLKQVSLTAAFAAALLTPAGFQAAALARTRAHIAELESTAAAFRSSNVVSTSSASVAGGLGKQTPGANSSKENGFTADGGIDLMELARLMAEGKNADPLRILKIRAALAAMEAPALDKLLASAETMDFPPDHRRMVYDRLLDMLADKDPALASVRGLSLVAGLNGNEATLFWMNPLPNAIRRWAAKDPAAARAWYDEQMKADAFQNRALGDADLDGWMAGGLFTGLMWGGDRDGGLALFETLDDKAKGNALRRFGTANNVVADREMILKLAAGITDTGARADAITGAAMLLARTDLPGTGALVREAALPPEDTRRLLVNVATEPLRRGMEVNVGDTMEWLRKETPAGQQGKALGYYLGDAAYTDSAGIRGRVDAELAAGADDTFLGAFIRNAGRRADTLATAVAYLDQLTDPAERTRTLRELQQGQGDAGRSAVLAVGVTATELDAALASK